MTPGTCPCGSNTIRDLAVFGCNAIELIPPRSDDDADSPHFPRPPMEMMAGMSRLADAYGLDVWIWYPAMDKDYSDPETVEFALREWGEVFAKLPRMDAVFVPGGDPGHTAPEVLMALLAKANRDPAPLSTPRRRCGSRRRASTRPGWTSSSTSCKPRPTGLAQRRGVRPAGPHQPAAPARGGARAQYPIRHYPDITHSRQCQYPVPDWDVAYALTEARECINPRPEDEAAIFRQTQPYTIGFLTYSEGCNDDVNKMRLERAGLGPGRHGDRHPAPVRPLFHRRSLRG